MNDTIRLAPYGNMLLYQKGYTSEFVNNVINEMNLDGLRIFDDLDPLESTDFLKEFVFLKKLDMHILKVQDYTFLKYLTNLEQLSIGSTYNIIGNIDLKNLVKLKSLSLEWAKGKIHNLQYCTDLEYIFIDSFKERDLSFFENNKLVKTFRLKVGRLTSIKGIEIFKNLEFLLLGNCPKLTDISNISTSINLNKIEFHNCSKVFDFDVLGNLSNLEILRINNCKDIKSIKFIEKLNKLKILSLLENTNIVDGDTTPARGIEEFHSMHRKHYNEKIINPILEERRKRSIAKIKAMFNI